MRTLWQGYYYYCVKNGKMKQRDCPELQWISILYRLPVTLNLCSRPDSAWERLKVNGDFRLEWIKFNGQGKRTDKPPWRKPALEISSSSYSPYHTKLLRIIDIAKCDFFLNKCIDIHGLSWNTLWKVSWWFLNTLVFSWL